jgi:pyruvate formate lyase activating enzyme
MMMGSAEVGMLIDIFRGSLRDGPGIRTTVFLKGCPLRCMWCHNPESWSKEKQLGYFSERCMNCFACTKVCPYGVHTAINGVHQVHYDLCRGCGKCIDACNYDALKLYGYWQDSETVFQEVLRDIDFYDDEGGLTISGGEPLFQINFTLSLLKKCKNQGINTCIETCGYSSRSDFDKVLKYVDLLLFDYKETIGSAHKKFTGVPNEGILDNLDYIYKKGAQIILRCPIIPGVNDSKEHFEGIARMNKNYPDLRGIEIIAYHNMGVSKGTGIGVDMRLKEIANTDEKQKAEWINCLKSLGCEKAKLG